MPESEDFHLVRLAQQKVHSLEKKVLFDMMEAIVFHLKGGKHSGAGGSIHKFIAQVAKGKFHRNNIPHFEGGSDEWVIPPREREMIRKAYLKI